MWIVDSGRWMGGSLVLADDDDDDDGRPNERVSGLSLLLGDS